jgi:hypothetical protein
MRFINPKLIADDLLDSAITTSKINDDAVTLAKMAPGTDGNVISFDASGDPTAIATAASGTVLTSGGAGAPPTFAAAAAGGKVLQVVSSVVQTSSTSSATIPNDTTAPQITEGVERHSLAITPTAADSNLIITCCDHACSADAGAVILGLWVVGTSDAIACSNTQNNTNISPLFLQTVIAAGSTSARTYKIRAGSISTATTHYLENTSNADLGDKLISTLIIYEIGA